LRQYGVKAIVPLVFDQDHVQANFCHAAWLLQIAQVSVAEAWDGKIKGSRAHILFDRCEDAELVVRNAEHFVEGGVAVVAKPAEANNASLTSNIEARFVMTYSTGERPAVAGA
jgi:hypothetical protein